VASEKSRKSDSDDRCYTCGFNRQTLNLLLSRRYRRGARSSSIEEVLEVVGLGLGLGLGLG